MDNRFECGCERGGDCTKTTMCQLQDALEDKDVEIERLRKERKESRRWQTLQERDAMKPVIDAARAYLALGNWENRRALHNALDALDRSKEQ